MKLIIEFFKGLTSVEWKNFTWCTLNLTLTVAVGMFTYSVYVNVEQTKAEIPSMQSDVVTIYPMSIIEYNLQDFSSDDEIYEQIKIWHEDEWGAQIGALRTICEYAPTKLHSVMTEGTQVNVCRLVK